MKAIIAGGGIAGYAAAVALRQLEIEVVVLEARSDENLQGGLFLSLATNGRQALEDLNLAHVEDVLDMVATDRMTFHRADGRKIAMAPMGSSNGLRPFTVMRAGFAQGLEMAARQAGAEIRHGARLTEYREDASGVEIMLSDGTIVNGDFLVGADGIHSRVRTIMHGRDWEPTFTGLVNFGGVVPGSGLPPTNGDMRMIWGHEAFFGYTVRRCGEAWWFANLGMTESSAWALSGTEQHRHRLLEQFSQDLPELREMVARTSELRAYPIHDLPSLPSWHDGRVVLIGDAAHAMSPSAGQGASLALEDALCLQVCLRDCDNFASAFRSFEANRKERAERIVREGRRRGEYKAPRNALQRWMRDLIVPFMLGVFGSEKSLAWIYEYRVPKKLDPIRRNQREARAVMVKGT
jgi:2-polyprenyl-6-methoxyphenol hydroxylase-like FAD-dependent oxidoreductase